MTSCPTPLLYTSCCDKNFITSSPRLRLVPPYTKIISLEMPQNLVGLYTILFWGVVLLCMCFYYYYYSSSYNQTECSWYRCDCSQRDSLLANTNGSELTNNGSVSIARSASEVSMLATTASPTEAEKKYDYYKSAIFDRMDEEDRFTIVMLKYKRIKTLPPLLLNYCKTNYLSKIVVIWNDVDVEISQDILQVNNGCAVPIVFIKETENKLTNRFKPRNEIKTDCEYSFDR